VTREETESLAERKQRAKERCGGGRWLGVVPCQIFPWSQYEGEVQTDHRER